MGPDSSMPPRRKKVPPKAKQEAALKADLARCKKEFEKPPAELPTQEDLPYNWEICKTKDGKVFYFNSATSEKRWDPPPKKKMVARALGRRGNSGVFRPGVTSITCEYGL